MGLFRAIVNDKYRKNWEYNYCIVIYILKDTISFPTPSQTKLNHIKNIIHLYSAKIQKSNGASMQTEHSRKFGRIRKYLCKRTYRK